jgi:hypothetical protein
MVGENERHRRRRQKARRAKQAAAAPAAVQKSASEVGRPDWGGTCESCGASPIVPETGMCGPCTFGEASTAGGNW